MKKPLKEIQKIKETSKRLSHKGLLNKNLRYFFRPIDYTRTAELPAVLYSSKILENNTSRLKILDISSPQILSASITGISNKWSVKYINPFLPELDEMNELIDFLSIENIQTQKIDITKHEDLNNLDTDYDYIFSSSVFEHIYPEDSGDTTAVKNIKQLLKPGGTFVISVPFYKTGFNEYKYGNVYSVEGNKNEKIFFQRFYDEKSLHERIINPSELSLETILYLGEKFYYPNNIHKRIAQNMQTKLSFVLFGKLFFLLSGLFFSYSEDYKNLKKPYIAVVTLRNK